MFTQVCLKFFEKGLGRSEKRVNKGKSLQDINFLGDISLKV